MGAIGVGLPAPELPDHAAFDKNLDASGVSALPSSALRFPFERIRLARTLSIRFSVYAKMTNLIP